MRAEQQASPCRHVTVTVMQTGKSLHLRWEPGYQRETRTHRGPQVDVLIECPRQLDEWELTQMAERMVAYVLMRKRKRPQLPTGMSYRVVGDDAVVVPPAGGGEGGEGKPDEMGTPSLLTELDKPSTIGFTPATEKKKSRP